MPNIVTFARFLLILFVFSPFAGMAAQVLPDTENLLSFRWEKMSRNQALQRIEETTDFLAASVLPENNPTTIHGQKLSDQIFTKVAENYFKQTGKNLGDVIPRPMVFVYDGPNFVNNGAVLPDCISWDMPTQIRGRGETDQYSGALKFDSYLQTFNGSSLKCRKGTSSELTQITKWLSLRLGCSVSVKNNRIEIEEKCRKEGDNGGLYEEFSFLTSMPVILVSKDHFEGFEQDNREGMAVISHEMVHYLRSHINFVNDRNYNYFYQWPEGKVSTDLPPALPKEDTESWLIIENVLKPFSSSSYSPFPEFEGTQLAPNVNGQILTALVYYKDPKVSIANICGNNSNCKKACSQLDSHLRGNSEAIGSLLEKIEMGETFDVEMSTQLVLATEAKVISCFKELDMSKALHESALALGGALVDEPIQLQVIEKAIGEGAEDEELTRKNIFDFFAGKNLYQYLLWLDKKYRNFNNGIVSNLKKLTSRHVGYYTGEEEADVLSLVLAQMAGWETQSLVDQIANKVRQMAQSLKRFNVVGAPLKECIRAYDKGWKDTKGDPYWAPLGTLLNLHHDPCYRLLRMDLTNKSL
ncbi:MAG: hypothetical protein KDD34_01980 [Bdellovibrionales bacterium]|nr:hypothetical protein [Bdellovibrionales bacterium]